MFNSLIIIMIQKKLVREIEFQCPHVAVSKPFGDATKQAAIREHALRSWIEGVENPSNPQINLEHTLQSAEPYILQVTACGNYLILPYRTRPHLQ
jgi:hypothetical protein